MLLLQLTIALVFVVAPAIMQTLINERSSQQIEFKGTKNLTRGRTMNNESYEDFPSTNSLTSKISRVIVPAHEVQDSNAEETFIYQVKRQINTWPFAHGIGIPPLQLQLMGSEAKRHDEEIDALRSNLVLLEEKIRNLTLTLESKEMIKNATEKFTSHRIDRLQNTIYDLLRKHETSENLLREYHQNTSTLLRSLETKLEGRAEKTHLLATDDLVKVLNLRVDVLHRDYESQRQQMEENERLVKDKENRTEQRLALLVRNAEIAEKHNSDRYFFMTNSITQFTDKIQNISKSVERMENEMIYEERMMENLQETVYSTNQRISDIEYSGGEHWTEQTNQCGGVVVAQTGIISYKFRAPYENNETCVWTIRTNRKDIVIVKLLEDGFQNQTNSDFISITHFQEGRPQSLSTITKMYNNPEGVDDRRLYTFKGPIIFVTFMSDSSVPGNGFMLKFEGSGNSSLPDNVNALKYNHFHFQDSSGFMSYPLGKSSLYAPNEFTTIVIAPPKAVTVSSKYSDMESESNCEYDSVNFYKSSQGYYSLADRSTQICTKKIPEESIWFKQRYCFQDTTFDPSKPALRSQDGSFLIIFASDNSNQFKGFEFSWSPKNE